MQPKLRQCPTCPGFLPRASARCPSCSRIVPPWILKAATLVGGGALAMTLSACYGGSCVGGRCSEPAYAVPAGCEARDEDGDGVCGEADCDEGDPAEQVCESRDYSDSMSTSSE